MVREQFVMGDREAKRGIALGARTLEVLQGQDLTFHVFAYGLLQVNLLAACQVHIGIQ